MNLLISLDGISAEAFEGVCHRLPIDHFAYVKQLVTTFPSVTFAAHMSAITGEPPQKHGIYDNVIAQNGTLERLELYRIDAQACRALIQVPTLFETLRKAGLRSASLNWPLTQGDSYIDYNEPELHGDETVHDVAGVISRDCRARDNALELAAHGTMDFAALHFLEYDAVAHEYGAASARAAQAADRLLGYVVAIKNKLDQCAQPYNVLVFSDHGHRDVQAFVYPNRLLESAGWRNCVDRNELRCVCDGSGSALLYSRLSEEDNQQVVRFFQSQRDVEGVYVFSHNDQNTHAPFAVVNFQTGICAEDIRGGEIPKYRAMKSLHGHHPAADAGMNGFLIAFGSDIEQSALLGSADLWDIAPTASRLCGIRHDCTGRVLNEILRGERHA